MYPPRPARTIVLTLTAALGGGGGALAASGPPQLTLRASHPVTVRGTHFAPRDRVRVTVRTETTRRTHHVIAGRRGAFTTTFGAVAAGPCSFFSVRATDRSGRDVTLRRPTLPACMAQ